MGFKPLPLKIDVYFYGLIIDKKTTFKLAFVQNQSTQCMCIHSQSHLLPIRFTICMNLLLRRAINIKFGHAKFCRKFSGRKTTPTDPHQRDFEPPPLQISGYATGPGRRLTYFLLCHYSKPRLCVHITTLHQLGVASRIELQPYWLQQASAGVSDCNVKSIT